MQKSSTVALIRNNKLLLLRRGTTAPWMPGRYCLPGGKLDKGETLMDCALRELYEETGIVTNSNKLMPLTITYKDGYSKVLFVDNGDDSCAVTLNWEHDHHVWVSYPESTTMSLVPTLPTVIKSLVSWGYLI